MAAAPALFDGEHRRLTVGLVLVVSFVAFEAIGVATALPAVLRHLGGLRLYGWAFSAFMLAQVAAIVVSGPVVDSVGMAPPVAVAAVLFSAGLVVGGVAPSMFVLVLGRALQGAGAGVLAVAMNVAVGRGYAPALRPRAYAVMSSAWVGPSMVGPLVAGVVAEHLTWRLVFLGLVPAVGAGAAVAVPALAAADRRAGTADTGTAGARTAGARTAGARTADAAASDHWRRPGERARGPRAWHPMRAMARAAPPLVVGVTVAVGVALVLEALGTRHVVPGIALGVAGLVLALPALARVLPAPGVAPGSRQMGAMAAGALANAAFFGAEAFLPLALTSFHHRSLTEAGVVLTVASLSWAAGAWVQAHGQERVGPRTLSVLGLGLVAAGVAGVAALDWASTPWWVAFCAWGVAGGGMGLTYATTTLVVVSAAGEGRQGVPVAALQVLMTLGIAVGAGAGGAALAWSVALGHGRAPGLRVFDVVLAGVALAGAAVALAVPRTVPLGVPLGAAGDGVTKTAEEGGAGAPGSRSRARPSGVSPLSAARPAAHTEAPADSRRHENRF